MMKGRLTLAQYEEWKAPLFQMLIPKSNIYSSYGIRCDSPQVLQKNIGEHSALSQFAHGGLSSLDDSTKKYTSWSGGGRIVPSRTHVTLLLQKNKKKKPETLDKYFLVGHH